MKSHEARLSFLTVLEERLNRRIRIRELTPALLEIVKVNQEEIGQKSAELLGRCQDWRATDRLVWIARNSTSRTVVKRVVGILEALNGDRAIDVLASGLLRDEVEVRIATCRALCCVEIEGASERIKKVVLEDKDLSVREAAVKSLVNFREGKIEKIFVSLLESVDESVRLVAVREIAKRKTASAVNKLAEMILSEKGQISQIAIDALCRIGTTSAVKAFLLPLKDETRRNEVIKAIQRNRMATAAVPLAELLDDKNLTDTERLLIVETLGVLDNPRASKGVLKALRHGSHVVRLRCIKILGNRNCTAAIGRLSAMVASNPSLDIRVGSIKCSCNDEGRTDFKTSAVRLQ